MTHHSWIRAIWHLGKSFLFSLQRVSLLLSWLWWAWVTTYRLQLNHLDIRAGVDILSYRLDQQIWLPSERVIELSQISVQEDLFHEMGYPYRRWHIYEAPDSTNKFGINWNRITIELNQKSVQGPEYLHSSIHMINLGSQQFDALERNFLIMNSGMGVQ
jgi:hypothetical protein